MPPRRFQDKVAIVTGGTRGIGKGISQVFVEEGAKVVICSNIEAEGRAAEAELNAEGPGQALFVLCELTQEKDIQRLIETTVTTFGRIDCLINNAGKHPPLRPIDDVSSGDLRQLLEVNVVAYFLTCKYALSHLHKSGGSIVNIGSLITRLGEDNSVIYAATKGAVESMSKSLAVEQVRHGVRVNTVLPSNIMTPMWQDVAKSLPDPEAAVREGRRQQMMNRYGTAREVGLACLYLAADATFTTGHATTVAGGADINFADKAVMQD